MQSPETVRPLLTKLKSLLTHPHFQSYPPVIGIDGKCGAGKTTLSSYLSTVYETLIVPMDDFFLPPKLRTPDRLEEPGGNIHYERLMCEVILPLKRQDHQIRWRRFDCSCMDYSGSTGIKPTPGSLILLEGSYSMRPEFRSAYALSVFVDVEDSLQLKRICRRNGPAALEAFSQRWIPMENRYFSYYKVRETCDIVLHLNGLPSGAPPL